MPGGLNYGLVLGGPWSAVVIPIHHRGSIDLLSFRNQQHSFLSFAFTRISKSDEVYIMSPKQAELNFFHSRNEQLYQLTFSVFSPRLLKH
jgi:hypothetical protein